MMNPTRPVARGLTIHEIKMFLVSFQLMELIPLAAIENPMMEPTI